MADHRSTASIKPMTYRKPAQMLCQLSYAVRSVRWSMRYFRTESSSFDINEILSVIIIFMYLHKNLDYYIVFYYIAPKCPNFLQTTGHECLVLGSITCTSRKQCQSGTVLSLMCSSAYAFFRSVCLTSVNSVLRFVYLSFVNPLIGDFVSVVQSFF